MELVEEQKLPIPKYLMKLALTFMRRSVRKRADFDITEVCIVASRISVPPPIPFGHCYFAYGQFIHSSAD
eukprot:scaffold136718_cov39-Prasinocladus_malaysianus.AAC.1